MLAKLGHYAKLVVGLMLLDPVTVNFSMNKGVIEDYFFEH